MANKPGRPPRDPSGLASKILPVRLTDAERTTYQRAAKAARLSLSGWIRDRLDKAAARDLRSNRPVK
jgi:hypothetical protein